MEHHRAMIMACVTIAVWSILLLRDTQPFESRSTNERLTPPPSMDVFENYEEMQKYISEKETRDPKKLENPLDDSYINAYNFHHENQVRFLAKRSTEVEQGPQIFKFRLEDAKEPDEETKKLIRKHRQRELQSEKGVQINSTVPVLKRMKRYAQKTEPRLIKFEASDAKEPNEAIKELIRQNRVRELRSKTKQIVITTTLSPQRAVRKIARKRTRRSAQRTEPQLIRFELEDAKEPDFNFRKLMEQMREPEVKSYSKEELYHSTNDTNRSPEDSSAQESKRFFSFQAARMKSKRFSNSVPNEVKKVIDLMLKDSTAQAYYKPNPANQNLKLKSLGQIEQIYETALSVTPLAPVVKNLVTVYPEPSYIQNFIPAHTYPVNILPPPSHHQPAGVSFNQIAVNEVSNNPQYYDHFPQYQPDTRVYQQSPHYLKTVPAMTQVFHEVPTPGPVQQQHQIKSSLNSIDNNEISKRYPYEKIIPLEHSLRHGKQIYLYPFEGSQQRILTNNHSGIDGRIISKNNMITEQQISLQDMKEFQELSALIGKSPTDQIHGLTYLLAKEMQRSKRLKHQRPQDNTSPILFHPEKNRGIESALTPSQESEESRIQQNQPKALPQPRRKSLPKDYTPIIEHDSHPTSVTQVNSEPAPVVSSPPPPPLLTSPNTVSSDPGLSPNYKRINQFDESPVTNSDIENSSGLQYASKYAFGYRVRDFNSGNDFGHKQNRDLDGVTRGQYHILLPDGRVQNVIYHADDTGFHADVSFATGYH